MFTEPGSYMSDLEIYNNTVYAGSGAAAGIYNVEWANNISGVEVFNNIFYTTTSIPMVRILSGNDVNFTNNAYYTTSGTYRYNYKGVVYNSLTAFRGTGQETYANNPVGFQGVNPQLTNPGGGGTFNDADQLVNLNAYKLQTGSPMIDAGLNLSQFAIDIGFRDYYGANPLQGTRQDIGAYETFRPCAVTVSVSKTNETVAGNNDGTAAASPGGGTAPYTYSWSNGGGGATRNNLAPGSYSVTVTDAAGCTAQGSVTIDAGSTAPPVTGGCANNIATNAGFESGNMNGWVQWTSFGVGTVAASGTYAARVSPNGGGFGLFPAAGAGVTYTFSAKVRLSGSPGWSGFGIDALDAAGNVISSNFTGITNYSYQTQTLTLTTPPNTASLKAWFHKTGSGGILWVDDVCLEADQPGCPVAGTACNDGNGGTFNDVEDGNCNCVGTACPPAGTACNDGNSNTTNDVQDGNCNCAGTVVAQSTTVQVYARNVGNNGAAVINVNVMNSTDKTWNNSAAQTQNTTLNNNWQIYTYTFTGNVSANRIRISFNNDANDRDVQISWIKVNGTQHNSIAPDTWSYGSWSWQNQCGEGYKQSIWLHCQGYFHYDTNGNGTNARGTDDTDTGEAAHQVNADIRTDGVGQAQPELNGTATLMTGEKPAFALEVFPNPSKNEFTILPQFMHEKVSGSTWALRVYDVSGRELLRETNLPADQPHTFGSFLRPGAYFVTCLTADGESKRFKVVKQ